MTKLYKVLRDDGTPHHGGSGLWSLPKDGGPGEWMPPVEPVLCRSGYHVCRETDLVYWLGPAIFEVEVRGEVLTCDERGESKLCAAEARLIRRVENWNERTARLFAADCAEWALPIFEKYRPNDDRPRKAIQAARDFAEGRIDDAARAAAGAAAWAAARAAARAAAWAAAGAAAGDAAEAAAWAAAGAAAGAWQVARLMEYLDGSAGVAS